MPAVNCNTHSLILKKENAHCEPIYCCVWTKTNTTGDPKDPGKDFLATGGLDGIIKVWSLQNHKLELFQTLDDKGLAVVSIAATPDGQKLIAASLDFTLVVWELLSGVKVNEIETGTSDIWKIVLSPEGGHVLTGGHSGSLLVYDIMQDTPVKKLDTRGEFVLAVDWSNNGKYMCSGAVNGIVVVFNLAQGKLIHTIEAHTDSVRSVAFSPRSDLIITASTDGLVKIFDVAGANLQCSFGYKCWMLKACFSNDGTRIAMAGADGTVTIALLNSFQVVHTFQEHTDTVWDIRFNAENTRLLSVSKDRSLNIYECPQPSKVARK